MSRTLAFAAVLLSASPAFADLEVRFQEGAPKDRFTLTNPGTCALGPMEVTIDLAGSSAGLVFDVTGEGAGVEVFQPFELVSGQEYVAAHSVVSDGDNAVMLRLLGLAAGAGVAFTIDVDDTIGAREITVSRSEIAGAGVRVEARGEAFGGTFTEASVARVATEGCS